MLGGGKRQLEQRAGAGPIRELATPAAAEVDGDPLNMNLSTYTGKSIDTSGGAISAPGGGVISTP